jgi:hypothetical protein
MKADVLHRLQRAWREVIQNLWARREEPRGLTPEEKRLVAILAAHMEYRSFWEDPATIHDEAGVEGVNPFLHVQFHAMVESQLALGRPPEVRPALDRLVEAGVSRHQAVHRLAESLARTMRPGAPGAEPYDNGRYAAMLRRLEP